MYNELNTPWRVVEEDDAMWILDSEGYYVTEQLTPNEARIIAAAPELLEVCKLEEQEEEKWEDCIGENIDMDNFDDLCGMSKQISEKRRQAIAKAEGKD